MGLAGRGGAPVRGPLQVVRFLSRHEYRELPRELHPRSRTRYARFLLEQGLAVAEPGHNQVRVFQLTPKGADARAKIVREVEIRQPRWIWREPITLFFHDGDPA